MRTRLAVFLLLPVSVGCAAPAGHPTSGEEPGRGTGARQARAHQEAPAAASAPSAAPGPSAAPAPIAAPAASGAPIAPPPLPTQVPLLPAGSELSRIAAPLLKKGHSWSFGYSIAVDPHGDTPFDPVRDATMWTLRCEVAEVATVGPARTGRLACKRALSRASKQAGEAEEVPDHESPVPRGFVLFGDALWATDGAPPDSEAALAALVQQPPTLRHPLGPSSHGRLPPYAPGVDMPEECLLETFTRPLSLAGGGRVVGRCATRTCAGMYGDQVDAICFAADLGVVQRDVLNHSGPSTERTRLLVQPR
jgi:hypothetical protein